MIVEDQLKLRAAAKAAAVLLASAVAVAAVAQAIGSNSIPTTALALLTFAALISLLRACWFFLSAQSRSKAWLLLPILLNALGLLALLCLADKSANKHQTWPACTFGASLACPFARVNWCLLTLLQGLSTQPKARVDF